MFLFRCCAIKQYLYTVAGFLGHNIMQKKVTQDIQKNTYAFITRFIKTIYTQFCHLKRKNKVLFGIFHQILKLLVSI